MKKKYDSCLFFDSYHNTSIVICSIIIILFIILFIFIGLFYKIEFSVSYSGIVVKEDDFYVSVVINSNDLQRLQENILVVDGKVLDYSIVKISDDYVLTESGPMRCVYLKFDFDDDKKIINNVIKLNFIRKSTIFSKLKEMI